MSSILSDAIFCLSVGLFFGFIIGYFTKAISARRKREKVEIAY